MKNRRIEFKWAIIFIVVQLLWMGLERIFGFHDENIEWHAVVTNLFVIPAFLVFIFALKDKNQNFYRSEMTYLQGFLSGLIITIIVTLFTPLIQYVVSTFISPDYFANMITHSVNEEMMDKAEAEAFFNLNNYLLLSTIGAFVMGVITSAIVALFFIKKKSNN